MKRIKLGQIGIGHNHGEAKMLAARKFPELFEIVGYAEENELKENGAKIILDSIKELEEYILKN